MSGGNERPARWTWAADRLNALVWRLPLPRRVRVLLSQFVYRNPPISQRRVLEVLQALEVAGVKNVAIGGWGIDALIGRQLRTHGDLDLLAEEGQLELAVATLRKLGFRPWHHNDAPGGIGNIPVSTTQALRDSALRVVELHEADLRRLDLAPGLIGGRRVSCLPAEHQLEAQQAVGRSWTPQRRLRKTRNLAAVEGVLQHPGRGT